MAATVAQNSTSPTSLGSIAITKWTNYGISILFDAGRTALVDIIFVHGLTGNAHDTWLHTDSQTHWPSDLLKQDIPDSRILSFGYDADIVNFWSPASKSRLGNHAENLVGDLVRFRERSRTEERKIIFVAHSLGGLVVEYALGHSRNSYEAHIHQIERFTCGIAFLGTPHHGSDLAKWGKFGTDIADIIRRPNKEIVAVLKPGSEMLDQTENTFHTILRKRKDEGCEISITCFWEELPLAIIGHVCINDVWLICSGIFKS